MPTHDSRTLHRNLAEWENSHSNSRNKRTLGRQWMHHFTFYQVNS